MDTKIVSYNLNGIRSAISKGLADWLSRERPDVVCFQELKAEESKIDSALFQKLGYFTYWHPAVKKGYSGVGIICKRKPDKITIGCGIDKYDNEGRVMRADFGDTSILSIYHPSGSSGEERQSFKMKWLGDFLEYVNNLRKERKKLILCGDYNICHKAIDIHNPSANINTSGFLPEERSWFDGFVGQGYVDTFRHFNKNPDHYSWWSFRANSRNNNKGWRIDYILVTENLENKLKSATIFPDAKHSDHCPVSLDISL